MSYEEKTVYDILYDVYSFGTESEARGLRNMELQYYTAEITCPWSTYPSRNYSIDYYKREMQWYLTGNKFDTRIEHHAKLWSKIKQQDGSFASNYGQYWFGSQKGFDWVVETLRIDPDSRQAYIAMNNAKHAYHGNPDFVCTKGIQFRQNLRNGLEYLDMHVDMRSSDAIFGIGTDLPCFWTLQAMVASELAIPAGRFLFSTDSVHVYERHYPMIEDILNDGPDSRVEVLVPRIDDPYDLISQNYESDFGRWLTRVQL